MVALEEITRALVDDLGNRYRNMHLQVIRNGAMQITLFRPNYQYTQIVVGDRGVHVVLNPGQQGASIRGPFDLNDPHMFNHLYEEIDRWLLKS